MVRLLALLMSVALTVTSLPFAETSVYAMETVPTEEEQQESNLAVDDEIAESTDAEQAEEETEIVTEESTELETDTVVEQLVDEVVDEQNEAEIEETQSVEETSTTEEISLETEEIQELVPAEFVEESSTAPKGVTEFTLDEYGATSKIFNDGDGYHAIGELYKVEKDKNVMIESYTMDLRDSNIGQPQYALHCDVTYESGTYFWRITVINSSTEEQKVTESNRMTYSIPDNRLETPTVIADTDERVLKIYCEDIENVDRIDIVIDDGADGYITTLMNRYEELISGLQDDGSYIWTIPEQYIKGENYRYKVRAAAELNNPDYGSSAWTEWQYDFWSSYEKVSEYIENYSFNNNGNGWFEYELADTAIGNTDYDIKLHLYIDGKKQNGASISIDKRNKNGRASFAAWIKDSGKYSINAEIIDNNSFESLLSEEEIISYNYNRPATESLDAPQNPRWNEYKATFDNVSEAFGYRLELFKDGDLFNVFEFGEFGKKIEQDFSHYIKDRYPDSEWYFRVYTIAKDNRITPMSYYSQSPVLNNFTKQITGIKLDKTAVTLQNGDFIEIPITILSSNSVVYVPETYPRDYDIDDIVHVTSNNEDLIYAFSMVEYDEEIGGYQLSLHVHVDWYEYGTSTITIQTANGKTATCKVTVPKLVTKSVSFKKDTYFLKPGEKLGVSQNRLTPLYDKDMYGNQLAIYSTNPVVSNDIVSYLELEIGNPDVLKLENWRIVALEPGFSKITYGIVTDTGKKFTFSADVIVTGPPESISFENYSGEPIKVFRGYDGTISYNINPLNATVNELTWNQGYNGSIYIWDSDSISMNRIQGTRQVGYSAVKAGNSWISINADGIIGVYDIEVIDKVEVNYDGGQNDSGKDFVSATYGQPLSDIAVVGTPKKEGCVFAGWYTQPNGKGQRVTENTIATDQFEIYAYWEPVSDSMRIRPIEDCIYTGSAIKPVVEVYDGQSGQLLEEKVDYTISYKNNTNAWVKDDNNYNQTKDKNGNYTKAPTVTVKGKGNYSGQQIAIFNIYPADISGEDFSADDIALAYNAKKVQKPKPVLKRGSKTLGTKDYTVTYENDNLEGAYKDPNTYLIRLDGKGNYTGTRTINFTITKKTLASKFSVKMEKTDLKYSGEAKNPKYVVKNGSKILEEGVDYNVSYPGDHVNVGTATVIFTGIGDYYGTKTVTYKITGEKISSASATKIDNKAYTGQEAYSADEIAEKVKLTIKKVELVCGVDYMVNMEGNHTKPGTAKVTFEGLGKYKGTKKTVSYKISACPIIDEHISIDVEDTIHTVTGAKPRVTVKYDDEVLVEGTDYTLAYTNNKKAWKSGYDPRKTPTIVVKGKGNYSGKSSAYDFSIEKKNLSGNSVSETGVTVKVPDKVAIPNAAGKYNSSVTLMQDGVKIPTSEYNSKEISFKYKNKTTVTRAEKQGKQTVYNPITLPAGTEIDKRDIIPADTEIEVTVTAKEGGNYTGNISGTYRVVGADISKASVKKITKEFTGSEITFSEAEGNKEDLLVTYNKVPLVHGVDYEIVPGTYKNNIKKGTAKVTIRGIGSYGGTKEISFSIVSRSIVNSN